MNRSHTRSLIEAIVGTGFLVGIFWVLYMRAEADRFGWPDAVIVVVLAVVGLAIGYRDRLSLVAGNVRKVWTKKGS